SPSRRSTSRYVYELMRAVRGVRSNDHSNAAGAATAAQRTERGARRRVSSPSSSTDQTIERHARLVQADFLVLVFGAAASASVATRLGGLRSEFRAAFAGAASRAGAPPLPGLARSASIRSITCAPPDSGSATIVTSLPSTFSCTA